MKRINRLATVLSSVCLAAAAQAHHSVTTHFDMTRSIEIRGVVVDFKLRSQQAFSVKIDARIHLSRTQQIFAVVVNFGRSV